MTCSLTRSIGHCLDPWEIVPDLKKLVETYLLIHIEKKIVETY
jgi:hypothetical protein